LEERIFFKLTIDIPDLDKLEPDAKKSELVYDGELVFETNSEFHIKIFFDYAERLDRKVMSWDPKYSYSLLSKFQVTEIISPKRLKHIDFVNYYHKGMHSGIDSQEFNKQYFTIKPTGIRLVYEAAEQAESEIYLNQTAFKLIELNYRYQPNFPWKNEEFKFEPINNIKEFIKFNDINFIPEHNFFVSNKSTDKHVSVEKEPRLRIEHAGATEIKIKEHVNLLCDLYSFYTNKKIDWKHSRIYAEGKLFVEIKDTSHEDVQIIHGIFIWDFIQNPLNLIRNVNAESLIKNSVFVSRLIERFNYALKTSDETKFMILYSILEQLRNHYILTGQIEKEKAGSPPNLNKVKEEYTFINGNTNTDKFIKETLRRIIDIVDDSDKTLFESEIQFKISGIKLMTMANQFESYFKFAGIEPKDFDLDFKELKSIRDDIFHGRPIRNKDYLNKVNWYEHLPRLTGELLIKFFGIDDLKTIEKKRNFG
jgi:hypothetical protein